MGLFHPHRGSHIPVWFMRQAGRYHSHYQKIKATSDFMTMCKNPDLAYEVTMGPIEDFSFSAAILFSDLLFPLEHLGMGLHYRQGPPMMEFHLTDKDAFERLQVRNDGKDFYHFQKVALEKLVKKLSPERSVLGFVGAPFTLYTYAMEGSHAGGLIASKCGLRDGRFSRFMDILRPSLLSEMCVQAEANPDAICLFDTAAGELCAYDYARFVAPEIEQLLKSFKAIHPHTRIIYYSKMTHDHYWKSLEHAPIDVMGIDWRWDLQATLEKWGHRYMIQGNIDPVWLHLEWKNLEDNLKATLLPLHRQLPKELRERWIMGLGHGVLQKTPETNVRQTVSWIKENLTLS
jgi:uroporphyrinogen decarboxylase